MNSEKIFKKCFIPILGLCYVYEYLTRVFNNEHEDSDRIITIFLYHGCAIASLILICLKLFF